MVEAPQTEEGWFALHDFRSIDWDAWRDAPERERKRAIEEGKAFLKHRELVADADEGDSGLFSVLGHKADLLFVHFRPTLDDLSSIERRFEDTALANFTERTTSYVSVTEVSGYVSDEFFEDPESVDTGLKRYIEGKMTPEIPDDEYVCFYPMSKRRGEEYNWYDLSFEDRADLMADHGEVGKEYAGKIKQVIASSVGFDSHEWGVTLFGSDPTDIKDIVYEMRFDPASSRYGEFGEFYIGRRFPPEDLGAYFAGETVPTPAGDGDTGDTEDGHGHAHGEGHDHAGSGGGSAHGDHPHGEEETSGEGDHPHSGEEGGHGGEDGDDPSDADIRGELADLNIYAGKPSGEDVYATVLYSEADVDELFDEVEGLRGNFDHYGTHVKTAVYEGRVTDRAAVVSIWDTASAAETAAGFLSELPEVVARAGEESGFGTMGMFYTVKPEHQEDFTDTFDDVGEILAEMDGHVETDLMMNVEDENDMFIASQWHAKEDAMAFFGSDEFRETVQWGREVLADRPRHVFLA
ncbi:heme-binding protein [Halorubrum lacusprofundi]|jgi:chlorite dismutase|uniref:Chlorite dismutase n=1 Tax=Halorubrum lacusprofundi (strain ATCC 49239 / DSM 5036 / JCM 8891 / ACAM 34) TaxID=416348 RepID=B9LRB6_HALLT|nr:heme-binding protein [Halorubrum lacusprofundi]ACM57770.1 Chlorite dismutase [Halorubrum lacusprofundi ATCC 49239]